MLKFFVAVAVVACLIRIHVQCQLIRIAQNTLTGRLNELLDVIPQDKMAAILKKHQTSDIQFRKAVEFMRSEEFNALFEDLEESEAAQATIEYLESNGVEKDYIGSLSELIAGLLPTEPDENDAMLAEIYPSTGKERVAKGSKAKQKKFSIQKNVPTRYQFSNNLKTSIGFMSENQEAGSAEQDDFEDAENYEQSAESEEAVDPFDQRFFGASESAENLEQFLPNFFFGISNNRFIAGEPLDNRHNLRKYADQYAEKYAQKYANSYSNQYANRYADLHANEHADDYAHKYAKKYGNKFADRYADQYAFMYANEQADKFARQYSNNYANEAADEYAAKYAKDYAKEYANKYADQFAEQHADEHAKTYAEIYAKKYAQMYGNQGGEVLNIKNRQQADAIKDQNSLGTKIVDIESSTEKNAMPELSSSPIQMENAEMSIGDFMPGLGMRSFQSFSSEVIRAIPRKLFREKVSELMQLDVQFAKFWNAIGTKEFRKLIRKAMQSKELNEIFKTLRKHGINLRSYVQQLLKIINMGSRSKSKAKARKQKKL